jgi:hypothetical protein
MIFENVHLLCQKEAILQRTIERIHIIIKKIIEFFFNKNILLLLLLFYPQ